MKKQNSSIKAHLLWSALILLTLLAVCAIPLALAQRSKQSKQAQEALSAGSPVVQQKFKSSAVGSGNEQFMVRMMPATLPGPVSFQSFENPAPVPRSLLPSVNALINNNTGITGCNDFTQSETTVVSFSSTIVAGFNDSGSFAGGTTNHFTGFSRSTDGGVTWTDGGTLPASAAGDAGDPVLARDSNVASAFFNRIYFATLGFTDGSVIQVFSSTDNGATWLAPINGAPGKSGTQDKQWITVDNFVGSGNGNVYLVERDFGAGNGVYFFRSTDGGGTWAPSGGTLIVTGMQGAVVTVNPDHSLHAWWFDGASIKARKSTDQGVTFGSAVTVVTFVASGGANGGLGLTGTVNGG